MKTYKIKISRDFCYEYLVKADSEEEAIQEAYDDWEGDSDEVELISQECYETNCMDSEEVKEPSDTVYGRPFIPTFDDQL